MVKHCTYLAYFVTCCRCVCGTSSAVEAVLYLMPVILGLYWPGTSSQMLSTRPEVQSVQ